MRSLSLFAVAALVSSTVACVCLAGPITPPAGPVASTMKTLTEVEPRTSIGPGANSYAISQPGSYYLTGNLANQTSATTIIISADDVTIDLNGFRISANPGTASAISSTGARTIVRNGSIKGGYAGINLATASRVENVNLDGCASTGILTQDGCTLVGCSVRSCGSTGISIGANSTVERCIVRSCSPGIHTDADCRLVSCTSSGNTGIGISMDGVAEGCIASGNTTKGFAVSGGSTIDRCTSQNNTTVGFSVDGLAVLTRCISTNNNTNGYEITGASSSLIECTASANAVFAVRLTASGISVVGCTLSGVSGFPVVHDDQGVGIRIERNVILYGTYGIDGGGQSSVTAVGNTFTQQSTAAMGLAIVYPHNIGTMYSSGGEVTTTNPWVNFFRP